MNIVPTYLLKVWTLIKPQRVSLIFLFPLYLLSNSIDLVGIGLIVGLVSSLNSNPTANIAMFDLGHFPEFASNSDIGHLFINLSILIFIVFVIKTIIAIVVTFVTLRITFGFGAQLRSRLMDVYQSLDYEEFQKRNKSEYIYRVQTLAGQLISLTVQPALKILSDGLLILMIFAFLIWHDPINLVLVSSIVLIFGGVYDFAFRKRLNKYGQATNVLSETMVRHITEGMNGFRESIVLSKKEFFLQRVSHSALLLANARIRSQLITLSSRYILEMIIILSVLCIVVISVFSGRNVDQLLPTLAVFLIAAVRVLPAANQVIVGIGRMRFGSNAVNLLYEDLQAYETSSRSAEKPVGDAVGAKVGVPADLRFETLELKDISFSYAGTASDQLSGISLKVSRNDLIGISGKSGAGKTTLIEIFLGLLNPKTGSFLLNGRLFDCSRDIENWHKMVAYIPQSPFLFDSSVEENVKLGAFFREEDSENLRSAMSKVQLSNILNDLSENGHHGIGENGNRLSGGQQQRLALARAFFHSHEFIILDEPTSALDKHTEAAILYEIKKMKGNITLIVISHSEAVLSLCNRVFSLDAGRLVEHKKSSG